MEKIIHKIIAESRYICYPDSFPKVTLTESNNTHNIDRLKTFIANQKDQTLKGVAYAALGVVGDQTKQDQSGFILGELLHEKNLTIEDALSYMTGCLIPIHDGINELKTFMDSTRKGVRHAALVASSLCESDWDELEIDLVERFIASKNAEDQFWIANAFSKKGSANCIPALHHAFENVSDSDVLVFCLQAAANIDAANQTPSLIKIVNAKKDNYVRRLAITALINESNIEALEPLLERANKILSKKASPKDIDYQGGYSELQACFMFLDLFKESDERITEFFKWAKEKRMDYMDDPTRKWAKKNLKTK